MKDTEQRIREHLEASTSGVRAPDRLDEIMERGRHRRVSTRVATVMAAAAALVMVVGVGSVLTTQEDDPRGPVANSAFSPDATTATSTADTTAPATTTGVAPLAPPGSPLGMVTTQGDGVAVYRTGGEETLRLSADEYQAVTTVFPDQRGGLVFQHSTTPAAWPQGSILRQSPSAQAPEVVASPVPGGSLIPVGPAVSSGGHAAFVYLSDVPAGDSIETRVMLADLDTGATRQLGVLGPDADLRVGGDVLASIDRSGDCPTLTLTRLDGSAISSPLDECLPLAASVAVSGDGQSLGVLTNGALTIVGIPDGTQHRRVEVGESVMVTAGVGSGWLVRAADETILIGPDETTHFGPIDNRDWAVPFARPIEIQPQPPTGVEPTATTAPTDTTIAETTGTCQPVEAPLEDQGLPEPVAATRRAIYAAASACDYAALAALAEANGTVVSVGGGGDTDPADFWRAEAKNGNRPLEVMALILSTTPAQQTETGTWAWPAIHADPAFEQSWAELEPILGADALQEMRDFGGYLGMRIGITGDGTWQFATAGD